MKSRNWALTGLAVLAVFLLSCLFWINTSETDFIKYRFPVGKPTTDLGELAALEKRTREMPGRALDLSDLALRYVNQARSQANRSYYEKAEQAAKLSLHFLSVSNAAAHVALAKVNEANHRFEEALAEAKSGLKASPESIGAWSVLVTSHLARGDVEEAAAAADKLVTLRPSTGHYALRGLTLLGQNREEEALFNFRKGFSVEEAGNRGESAWSRGLLGRHWFAVGKYKASENILKEAARIAPESDFIQSLLAELYLKKGDSRQAEIFAQKALELSPQPRYLRLISQIKTARGDKKSAEGYLREAEHAVREELSKSRQGHRLELAQILLEGGGKERAEEAVRLAREETELRRSGEAFYWFARAFAAVEKWPEAATAIEQSLRRGERIAERYRLAADIQRHLNHPPGAALYDRLADRK